MIPIAKPVLGNEEIEAVVEVLHSGRLAQGRKVEEFEEAFASYIGTRYAVAVNSGTAALHLALLAHGIGEGDEVITTPFSFIATGNAILFTGAKPVFVDIDEKTFNLDPDRLEEKITPRTKAILPVHLYGQPCVMDKIMDIAAKHNLAVIEDACQAHGAKYKGQKVGSFGTGCFSFYPTKNMITGEGGMVTTNNKEIAEKLKMLRNHGQKVRYFHEMLGYNLRMTDLAAAIGLCQLKKLEDFNAKRRSNAQDLTEGLQDLKGIITPYILSEVKHVFHQYTIRVSEKFGISRDTLREELIRLGINTEIYYPLPIHCQPFYRQLGYKEHLPRAEKASREVLSLPVHPAVSGTDIQDILDAFGKIISK
ncbi:MAG: DegT/DnrJ/EryC1/StrS family aminotransferase [Firmicutes bacterium]|uniref:Predicted pyridoxal phosphate-dependent enzyme n=1 Tax=Pelotomaculum thermopropionicum (strain DSM 13744 / JCM 10971 / SI) TaxID=370438 RepID=A5D5C0_PELTS|nr:DegT/DnrJ/EryC1/StrS family aminotransferase [Bacillota bacterium]BAF58574.1 predicted pyridoxal phosphate-dependent enzyme [Pelotomaculum thermopropionicum SI]